MMRLIEREFTVDVSVQAAWNHLAEVEKWPSWAANIRRADLDPPGPLTAATKGAFRLSNGVRSTFEMTEFDPPKSWKWKGPFLWLTVYYHHRFEPAEAGGTKLTWTVDAEGAGVGTLGKLFARVYTGNLDRAIPALAEEIQRSE